MKTKRGPYGQFAVTMVDETNEIYEYALKIIESGHIEGLLPAFCDEKRNGLELSFDYSGLNPISKSNNDTNNNEITMRRKAIGDLFMLFIKLLNSLMPVDNIVLDKDYIFYNKESNRIELCYLPYISNKDLNLNSIDSVKLEKLLNDDFFKKSLTSDEITTITYSIKNNDEKLLEEIFTNINFGTQTKAKTNRETTLLNLLIIISSISASILLLTNQMKYGLIISIFVIALLGITYFNQNKNKQTKTESSLHNKRAEILFEKETAKDISANDLFSFACLIPVNSSEQSEKIGLYSNETIIGSDRFISDVHIKDLSVSKLQAKIIHEDNSYYLIDLSDNNNTFLENRNLISHKKYEIKNGQLLRFGTEEYYFKIGF